MSIEEITSQRNQTIRQLKENNVYSFTDTQTSSHFFTVGYICLSQSIGLDIGISYQAEDFGQTNHLWHPRSKSCKVIRPPFKALVSNTRPAGQIRPAASFYVAPSGLKDTRSPFLKEIKEKFPVLLF